MTIMKAVLDPSKFNSQIVLPYQLRISDFRAAMEDVYDFFFDVNSMLSLKGLDRLDDMLRPAACSGILSDMLTAALAQHARGMAVNAHFNGHPDLLPRGHFPNDAVASGNEGVEIKATVKKGGAVDTHGARDQWMCVFTYIVDKTTQPARDRAPLRFREVYIARVKKADFRENGRGELGTRTATLHAAGIKKLQTGPVYVDLP